MLPYLLILIISAVVLARSSIFLIQKLTTIAIKLRVSEYLVGFVIMAVATSLPELTIGIISGLEKNTLISLGNVLGANIADLTLVIGLGALIGGGIRIQTQVRNREVIYADLIGLAPLVLLLDRQLTRPEGLVLILLFVLYIYNLVFQSREYHKVMEDHRTTRTLAKELVLSAGGLAVLLLSAEGVVRSGRELATILGIPAMLIGVLLGLGTTLPELSTTVAATVRKQGSLIMGNILGSVVTNSTLVLGTVALINPITLDGDMTFKISGAALLLALVIVTKFIRSQYRIDRAEALALVLGYIFYLAAVEFFR